MPPDETSPPCTFCEILAGRLPSSQVYSDADVVAFMDIRPANAGHMLVVPRRHVARLEELDERTGERVFAAAHRLSRAVYRSGLPCHGIDLFLADGEEAGQEVFHVHLHVLPRFAGDGFKISARWLHPDRAELDETAATLRESLAGITTSTPVGLC